MCAKNSLRLHKKKETRCWGYSRKPTKKNLDIFLKKAAFGAEYIQKLIPYISRILEDW